MTREVSGEAKFQTILCLKNWLPCSPFKTSAAFRISFFNTYSNILQLVLDIFN